jgi:hypothetical protein
LVGEDSVSNLVDFGVDILDLASVELVGVDFLEGFGFGRSDVLAGLVEVALWGLASLGVVLLYVVFGE